MKISINANRCEPSPMRKFHPLAVKAKKDGKKTGKKSKFHNFEQRDIDFGELEDEYFDEILKGMKSDDGQ